MNSASEVMTTAHAALPRTACGRLVVLVIGYYLGWTRVVSSRTADRLIRGSSGAKNCSGSG